MLRDTISTAMTTTTSDNNTKITHGDDSKKPLAKSREKSVKVVFGV